MSDDGEKLMNEPVSENVDRRLRVLEYIYAEGYVQTSTIKREIFSTVSMETVRVTLRDLHSRNFIDYKEFPTSDKLDEESAKSSEKKQNQEAKKQETPETGDVNASPLKTAKTCEADHKQKQEKPKQNIGAKERVHHLTEEGLKILGKQPGEIAAYMKSVGRIRSTHLRHFVASRKAEKAVLAALNNTSEYLCVSWNEFKDIDSLHINLRHNGSTINLRPDIMFTIQKDGKEILTIRGELDRSTEALPQIIKKLDSYAIYSQSSLIEKHSKVFPQIIMFIATERRIHSIAPKLKSHRIARDVVFLALEWLEKHDLLRDPLLLRADGKYVSLASILEERVPVLGFVHAVTQASEEKTTCRIAVHSRFTERGDTFFPPLKLDGNELWMPDGWLSITAPLSQTEETEVMFSLIASVYNETSDLLIEKMLPYEAFLVNDSYRQRMTQTPCVGCFIIVRTQEKIKEVINVIRGLEIGSVCRVILQEDCVAEKILDSPVLFGLDNSTIALFPAGDQENEGT